MRLLLNAVNLRAGGGKSVLSNFLRALCEIDHGHEVVGLVPGGERLEELSGPRMRIVNGPEIKNASVRPLYERLWVQRQMASIAPDVLFSMGNLAIPAAVPQLLLFHWSYAVYPDSPVWHTMDWRSRYYRRLRLHAFRRSLRHATWIAAQTATARFRLEKLYGLAGRVHVVPNAVSLFDCEDATIEMPGLGRGGSDERVLLCLTRYYPHKNLEVLVRLARLVRAERVPMRIVLTISGDQHPRAAQLLATIEREGLGEILYNIGPVGMDEVPALYRSVDGMILPTLLESFSGTYVESMHYRVPIFTSDLDFARDVCGDVAYYFDPVDEESLYSIITTAFQDAADLETRVANGRERVAGMPDWQTVAAMYLELLEKLFQLRNSRENGQ